MNKTPLYHIIIFMCACACASCSSWDEEYANTPFEAVTSNSLAVSTNELTFPDIAEKQKLVITAQNFWSIQNSAPAWLSLSADHGKGDATLTVFAQDNTAEARNATIIVSNGLESYTIHVSQAALQEKLILSKSSLTFAYQGAAETIGVEANTVWAASSDVAWLKVTKNNENTAITVVAAPNISTESRQGIITIQSKGLSAKISVTQQGVKAPTVQKPTISNITKHSANCKFNYQSQDMDVIEYGVCYSSTNKVPTTANAEVTKQASTTKSGTPSMTLSGLKSKTTYYARSYITTALGTLYSEAISFTTLVSAPQEGDNGLPTE